MKDKRKESREKFHEDFARSCTPLNRNPNPIGRTIMANKLWNDHLRRCGIKK